MENLAQHAVNILLVNSVVLLRPLAPFVGRFPRLGVLVMRRL